MGSRALPRMRYLCLSSSLYLCLYAWVLLGSECDAEEGINNPKAPTQEDPPSLAESQWNSTEQNPLITAVTLKTANGLGLESFRPDPVFENGNLVGNWAGCGENAVQFSNCVVLPSYVDRIFMTYTFDIERGPEYTFNMPTVKVLTSEANPEISDFDHTGTISSFTLFFNCAQKKSLVTTEVFELDVPILRNFSISTRFTKRCRSGPHPYVLLSVTNGATRKDITNETGVIQVPPTVQSSEFVLEVISPADSILPGAPTLTSSDKDIGVTLRGMGGRASVVRGADQKLWIMYDCQTNFKTNVSLSIPIPPWDDLTVQLEKNCGGGAPQMLDIGTAAGLGDVVKNGEATPEYNVRNAVGYTNGKKNHVVGRNTSQVVLHIGNTNAHGLSSIHLGKLHVTVSNSDIVRVILQDSQGAELGMMQADEKRVETVRFVCLREGKAEVIFSLPVLQFRVVEFCMTKECNQPHAIHELGWESIWTVEGIGDLVLIAVVMSLLWYCFRDGSKRQMVVRTVRGRSFERVPTS